MKPLEIRVKEAEEKFKQLRARQQMVLSKKRAMSAKKQHADDTRRKVLIGAMFWERMTRDEETNKKVLLQLERWLTRSADRALFGLPSEEESTQTAGAIHRNP